LKTRIESICKIIDDKIANKSKYESCGLLEGLGGVCMYHSYRYELTNELKFRDQGIETLEELIIKTNLELLPNYLSLATPYTSCFFLIEWYVKLGILDEDERNNSMTFSMDSLEKQ
jgi:hypothetical protein